MSLIHVIGGLGNQMFQVAFAYVLKKQSKSEIALDLSSYQNYRLHHGYELKRIFDIDFNVASESDKQKILGWLNSSQVRRVLKFLKINNKNSKYIVEPSERYCPELLKLKHEAFFQGYWQSEKYFSKYADEIRQLFEFKPALSQVNQQLSEEIRNCNSVSIHIRRGDYISDKANQSIYYQCSPEFYHEAINYICNRAINLKYYVFSDDIEWSKSIFTELENVTYVSHNRGKDSYVDMQLMSLCKHNIIANSTFSWWGAWLNRNPGKIVVSPKEWFINGRSSDDLIPENWLRF